MILGRQRIDNRPVGRQQADIHQRSDRLPAQCLTLDAPWLAGILFDDEYMQGNNAFRVFVRIGQQVPSGLDSDADFFVEFPHQRLVRGLRRLQFAAGKLPPASLVRSRRTFGKQNPTEGIGQNACRNLDRRLVGAARQFPPGDDQVS